MGVCVCVKVMNICIVLEEMACGGSPFHDSDDKMPLLEIIHPNLHSLFLGVTLLLISLCLLILIIILEMLIDMRLERQAKL